MEEIVDIHKKVWSLFDYTSDDKNFKQPEHWMSHAKEVKEGKRFKDDCDGFALTCCELLIEAGFPKEDVKMVVCQVEDGGWHAVCGIDIEDTTYILDNRFKNIFDYKTKKDYTFHNFMKFSDPGQWYKVM
jgi:predicted transglutaminase-like cysteine proteinase